MADRSDRLWWPFPVQPVEQQSQETRAKIVFLENATSQGLRAFIDGNDCGAIAGDGREGYLVWRGKQRCELLLIDAGTVVARRMCVDLSAWSAFRQASIEALDWLTRLQCRSGPAQTLETSVYDDEYATCAETYATLCIYPGDLDPDAISSRLGIQPSDHQRRGEIVTRADRPTRVATINGWFLSTRNQVDSRDSRRHIDWLLDRLTAKAEAIRSLQEQGCRTEMTCYWLSRDGHGGPTIPPSQMRRLAALDLELSFDIYGPFGEDLP